MPRQMFGKGKFPTGQRTEAVSGGPVLSGAAYSQKGTHGSELINLSKVQWHHRRSPSPVNVFWRSNMADTGH